MQNMSRHSKKIVSMMMIAVITLTIGVCSFSFESDASNTYYVDYAEPSTSDNQGYLIVEFQTPNGDRGVDVFYWYLFAIAEDGTNYIPAFMDISVRGDIITFTPAVYASLSSSGYMLSHYTQIGQTIIDKRSTSFSPYTFDAYSRAGNKIVSVSYNGNIGYLVHDLGGYLNEIYIVFNSQENAIKLQALYEQMLISNANDSTIINKLDSIMNSNASIDTKLSQLIELQEEENTWLQKIWSSIQRFFKGDNATDDKKVEEFNSTSKEQSETLNELNEQNKTDKIDVDSTSNEIDANIDTEAIENYGTVLSVFTNNTHIFQYILIVLAVALIAYVLFGKR